LTNSIIFQRGGEKPPVIDHRPTKQFGGRLKTGGKTVSMFQEENRRFLEGFSAFSEHFYFLFS
jgi:hypothetical protein